MTQPQILINQVDFNLPTGTALFRELTLAFSNRKTGLVGRNGVGKSTLIKLLLGEINPHAGSIQVTGELAYVPQNSVDSPQMTVAEFWDIEKQIQKQLALFGLDIIPQHRPLHMLSGGEMTKLLLAKAFSSDADFLLLDEPTNHLDSAARKQLYQAIRAWHKGLIVVSHDRTLLNLMEEIVELTTLGASCYGGNYDEFAHQKSIEQSAKERQLHDAKKSAQKTKYTIQASREKHDKRKSYGQALRERGSIDKLSANAKKGQGERTQSKLLVKEERMLKEASRDLELVKENMEVTEEIQVDLPETAVPNGKIILSIENLSFTYPGAKEEIIQNLDLTIQGPEKIALIGDNGSGKTTLIKLILGELPFGAGKIDLATNYVSYLDQNASLLNPDCSILENFLLLNSDAKENDAYRSLAKFLFKNTATHKPAKNLSGGEKLRALLACVFMSIHPPQLLILDEPTNHLDLHSIESIESALKNYRGAMIVISHDQRFLENIGITRYLRLPPPRGEGG